MFSWLVRIVIGLRKQRRIERERDLGKWHAVVHREMDAHGRLHQVKNLKGRVVTYSFQKKGRQWNRAKGTAFTWTKPLSLHMSKEACFNFPLPSWMIHTSAVMCPLVV